MSRIKYELFGHEAAIRSFNLTESGSLFLTFPDGTEGFVRVGARIYKLTHSVAHIDLAQLDDGEHKPILFVSAGEVRLCGFEKEGRIIRLLSPSAEELLKLGLLTKSLEKRLEKLESRTDGLQNRIYNSKIF
jgi:hypothetical protein